jgi:hypothetical protein
MKTGRGRIERRNGRHDTEIACGLGLEMTFGSANMSRFDFSPLATMMHGAPDMPELRDDAPTGLVHGVGYPQPAHNLFVGPEARCEDPS